MDLPILKQDKSKQLNTDERDMTNVNGAAEQSDVDVLIKT